MNRFFWLVDGLLAGCSLPGYRPKGRSLGSRLPGRRDPAGDARQLDQDLGWLRRQGIGAVLSLTEEPLADDALRRHGLDVLHLPVPDLTAPSREQFQRALAFIDWQVARGRGVAVHCLMGQGRTGTVLCAYLIRRGQSVEQSLVEVRSACPGAVGSPAQERALERYAQGRDWFI